MLKKYKTKWYKDRIINTISDYRITTIKRMRIGNSSLNYQKKDNTLKSQCGNCKNGIIETNEHYFLSCPKYHKERNTLLENIKLSKVKGTNTMKTILGFFPEIYKNKTKYKIHKKDIETIFRSTMDYITSTGRFKIKNQ